MIESVLYVDRGRIRKAGARDVARIKKKSFWMDIKDPTQADMEFLKKHFRFHRLALEDCIKHIQRPKIDDYGSYYFISMHSLEYHRGKNVGVKDSNGKANGKAGNGGRIVIKEIDFFLGKNFVITAHKGEVKCVEVVKKQVFQSNIIQRGADFTMYVMLDILVDDLFPLMDVVNEKLETIENSIFKNSAKDVTRRLFRLRRNIVLIRKYISPEREVLNILTRGDAKFVSRDTIPYLRDIYDHLYRIAEGIDMARDAIISSFESHMSLISNRMNEIVKTLTIIATIILPMSLVASIYGMNFRSIPELEWQYGYQLSLGIMALIAVIMLVYFRRKRWV